jgi:hypothetical protein
VRFGWPIRSAVFLLLAGVLPSVAQQAEPERWQLRGNLGIDLTNTTQSTLDQSGEAQNGSGNSGLLGDLRLNGDGYLLDPRFLHLNLAFDGARGANSTDIGSIDHSGLNWGLTTALLPRSHAPLRVFYARSRFDSSGLNLDQNSDDSRLGVDWNLTFPKLPRINLGLERFVSDVRVPTALADVSFGQRSSHVGLNDSWKGWMWDFGFGEASSRSNALIGVATTAPFRNASRAVTFTTTRSFWEKRGSLSVQNHDVWRTDRIPDQGENQTSEVSNTAILSLQHTQKLSSSYSYSFVRVGLNSSPVSGSVAEPENFLLILPATFTAHSLNGSLNYTPKNWLKLSQSLRFTHTTPDVRTSEGQETLTEAQSTVGVVKSWHQLDFDASYGPRIQRLTTNLGRSVDKLSHDFSGRAAWGELRTVRLGASYRYSNQNLLEQIGGFTNTRDFRFDVESQRFRPWTFRASLGRAKVELLNLTGNTSQEMTNFSFQVNHPRFSLGLSQSLGDGAGAVFPGIPVDREFLIVPLPVGSLVFTPLLDRTTRARSADVVLRLHRRVDLSADYRSEKNLFFASRQDYRVVEVRGRYRIGKMTFEAGMGNFLTEIGLNPGISGNQLRRYFVRIGRDFTLF